MSTALPAVIALLVGAALGGGLGLAALAYFKQMWEQREESLSRERDQLLEALRELAHKVSAPDQAAIDHVFEKAQARRMQERETERRQQAAREIDRELAARGITLE